MPFPFPIWTGSPTPPPGTFTDWFERSTLETPDTALDDGDRISKWTDGNNGVEAEQTTSGLRPTWRASQFPGLGGIEVQDDRHLRGEVTTDVYYALVICQIPTGAARGLLARDTGAATNKPAFSLRVTDDFG
jgi:hypothetical protein